MTPKGKIQKTPSTSTAIWLFDDAGSSHVLPALIDGCPPTPLSEACDWLGCFDRDEVTDLDVAVDSSACWSDLEDVGDMLTLVKYIDETPATVHHSGTTAAFWAELVDPAA